jgi:transcriptional regulator with XRE-family HTH domain
VAKEKRPAHVGGVVAAARARAGLTRNALAVRAGLDPAYLMRLEAGTVKAPSFDAVCKLADALGVSCDDLRPDG